MSFVRKEVGYGHVNLALLSSTIPSEAKVLAVKYLWCFSFPVNFTETKTETVSLPIHN